MIVVPLLSNIFTGDLVSINKIRSYEFITEKYPYVVYAVIIFSFSVFYFIINFKKRQTKYYKFHKINSTQPSGKLNLDKRIHKLTGVLSVAGVFLFIEGTGMSIPELLVASRFEWFGIDAFSPLLLNIGLYLISLIALYAYFDTKLCMPIKSLSFVVYAAILFMIFVAGGRKWILFIASGALGAYYERSGGQLKVTKKIIFAASLVLFFAFSWQYYRAINWSTNLSISTVIHDFFLKSPELFLKGDITYFYRASLEAIKLNIQDKLLFPIALIRRLVLLPFPHSWTMGLKPEDFAIMFSDVIGGGSALRRGNMPPGIIGLFALSFGWFITAISFGPIMVCLLSFADKFILKKTSIAREAVLANFFVISILLMRGSESSLYFMVFSILVIIPCKHISSLSILPVKRKRLKDESINR